MARRLWRSCVGVASNDTMRNHHRSIGRRVHLGKGNCVVDRNAQAVAQMIYRPIAYAEVSTYFACSTSWVTQNQPARADNSYFNTMIGDSIRGLQEKETVYVFTQEQLCIVLQRCETKNMRVRFKELDGCYRIERVLK